MKGRKAKQVGDIYFFLFVLLGKRGTGLSWMNENRKEVNLYSRETLDADGEVVSGLFNEPGCREGLAELGEDA